jgi:hypothetical protein
MSCKYRIIADGLLPISAGQLIKKEKWKRGN